MMQLEHAEHTLEIIRTLMDRSQRYEHLSGYSGLLAGGVTLVGCAILGFQWLPFDSRTNFTIVWSAVLIGAFLGHALITFGRAHQRGERVWTRQARTVLLAVLPCFITGLAITIPMMQSNRLDLLPSLWL